MADMRRVLVDVQNVNVDVHDVTRTDAHTMAVHAHAETFDPKVESLFRYLQVNCFLFELGSHPPFDTHSAAALGQVTASP